MSSKVLAFLLLIIFSYSSEAKEEKENTLAIVKTNFSGPSLKDIKNHTFLPGEIVRVISRNKEKLLIENEESPWVTAGGVFVPENILVFKNEFVELSNWNMKKQVDLVYGDYQVTFFINSDASFNFGGFNENGGRVIEGKGKFYKKDNIIWAKKSGETIISKEDLFVIKNSKLCWPVPAKDCTSP